ncbi:class I SAM-dependent methyltransferase [Psychroserpens burtonensis]|uniref:Class I SAM-dependent methyltransferase n=1 Tax=Psychroserpens burtonensis TaxID=49278 RepID=A0A5C7BC56_9FLAO|nr:class I SAM-dependent methyltransferase [Psychroserpens burtonensis]TXE20405.1 class I SAM-dependent methyltransferase [Psychroserpens burtonensis]
MNTDILNSEIQKFISNNINTEVSSILLKGTHFSKVTTKEIIEQIEAKVKCKKKLPTWFSSEKIYYPNKLNIEQTSSEITAEYKSKLFTGKSILDITGGFGVDCLYFSRHFKEVTYCDIDEELSAIVAYNYTQLQVKNIKTVNSSGIDYLLSKKDKYDWVYIDPSRRHKSKGKVFFLKECLPNVPLHLETLFKRTNNIAIKTSPLLDLSIGISELKHVKDIHIIAVKNEVKELIWILENDFKGEITVKTANIVNNSVEVFNFKLMNEATHHAILSHPLHFLYEPNAAILKSGAFNSVSKQLKISKIHQHSHLYTSNEHLIFPGRSFTIESIVDYSKKNIKSLKISQANITTRNFPETVQNLRKKYSIKDGGHTYLFFTTNLLGVKLVIICNKL